MTGYFAELERELCDAAERQLGQTPSRKRAAIARRIGGRRLRIVAMSLLLVAVAGVPAAAVTGVFGPHAEPDGLVRLTERRVIAEGTTPDRGRWQLTASQSDRGFCFGITLPTQYSPGGSGTTQSEGCGGTLPGTLSIATSSGGTRPSNALAFGMTPDDAVRVRVQARGVTLTVKTVDDNAGLNGRFYVAELPIRRSIGPTTVTALDSQGTATDKATLGAR